MANKPILAIDPGTFQSAVVGFDGEKAIDPLLIPNDDVVAYLSSAPSRFTELAIEKIRPYGMAVGQSTIDTTWWSGRFYQVWPHSAVMVPRVEVKKHICKNGLAKDTNIIQALIDRFAYGQGNRGKGTKREPGFFFGFKKDVWQAFALAVTFFEGGYKS